MRLETTLISPTVFFEHFSNFHFLEASTSQISPSTFLKSFLSDADVSIKNFWSNGKQKISQLSRSQTIVLGGAVLITVGLALVRKGKLPLLPIIGGASMVAGTAMMIAPNSLFTDTSEFINDLKLQYQFMRTSLKEVFNQPLFNN